MRQSGGHGKTEVRTTKIDISRDVFVDKVWEVLSPLCAANETILCKPGELSNRRACIQLGRLTSSASQLAIRMLLRGFQPLLTRAPKPRITSCITAVPLDGSLAPITYRALHKKIIQGLSLLQLTQANQKHEYPLSSRESPTHRLDGSQRR